MSKVKSTKMKNTFKVQFNVTADHITYTDQALPKELDNSRLWFIKKMHPMSEHDWSTARQLSIYWFYKGKLTCEYNAAVERKVQSVLEH